MADWSTISSLATGAGTLVLALATFASVRSANRSARVAEQALREQRRPVLVQSRLDDPEQKIGFIDGHWVRVPGSRAAAEHLDGTVYLAVSLRNVGNGIAVLRGWTARAGRIGAGEDPAPEEELRILTRDLYVPSGDVGLWQGAIRDAEHPRHGELAEAIAQRQPLTVELLYSDHAGGQRTVSRFMITPVAEGDWLASVARHWYLDGTGPR